MAEDVGLRIKRLRESRKLSLNQLARTAGLAPSFVSQVERGAASLSIKSLRAIATALDVPAFQLIQDEQQGMVVRLQERAVIQLTNSGQSYELLSPNTITPVRMVRLVLDAGRSTAEDTVRHTGHEIAVVLRGTAIASVAGQEYHLNEGDSIYFDSTNAHAYSNPGEGSCEILISSTMTRFL